LLGMMLAVDIVMFVQHCALMAHATTSKAAKLM
jgi:hypothetical protein